MNQPSFTMTAPPPVYRTRRAKLAAALKRPIVIFGGRGRARNYPTNPHPFRAGSSYLYFGGPPIEGAAMVIEPGSDGTEGCSLVRNVMGFDDLVWIGASPADEELSAASGIDTLITADELASRAGASDTAYIRPPCLPTTEWVASLGFQPAEPEELTAVIDLRLIQDEFELEALRRAAKLTVEAHRGAIQLMKPGRTEVEVAAAFIAVVNANHCPVAFNPIVTTHGEVLHSEGYPSLLEPGRLLVVDTGAEEPGGYASDTTRTYPISGEFTPMQRQLYDTVLKAERAGVDACVPGTRYRDVHDLTARVICEGLVEAELLRGDPAELAQRGAHTLFYPHGAGHLVGLDVHDMEDFGDLAGYAPGRTRRPEFGSKFLRLDRDLQAGMSVTIEPGIYFVPPLWQNAALVAPFADVVNLRAVDVLLEDSFGGIRIEDTIHITAADTGPEILTDELQKDASAVAALIAG